VTACGIFSGHVDGTTHAATRADELTTLNQDLTRQLQEASAENATCRARITALEDDLTAARTSLRRMIRDENLR
jgi:cell division protein FtsB